MFQAKNLRERWRLMFSILVPVLIYQLANFSASFVDAMMTGQYSAVHLAGVGVATNLWAPAFNLLNGIVVAVVPIVGQLLGARRERDISSEVRQFLYIGVVLSVVLVMLGMIAVPPILQLMALEPDVAQVATYYLIALSIGVIPLFLFSVLRSFLDALGLTRLSMGLMVLILPFNIALNGMLIYGKFGLPALGGAGAGLGTALSYWLMLAIAAVVIAKHPQTRAYHLWRFEAPAVRRWGSSFRLGVPIGFSIAVEVAIFAVVGLLMAPFGSVTLASHQSAMTVLTLIYAFPVSISQMLSIIVAYEVGAQRYTVAKQYVRLALTLSLGLAVLLLGLLYTQRHWVASLFSTDEAFIRTTTSFLTYGLLFQLFDATAAPIQGALRGYKDVRYPFLSAVVGFWCLGIPIGLLLQQTTSLGPASHWMGLIIGLGCNCGFLVARLIYREKHQ